ncbi:MAG TPA: CAP domain-containing protein [Gaiellaceae bacterium]|nr:CAP domain-containing protein [Gaiellaceae bacterium]
MRLAALAAASVAAVFVLASGAGAAGGELASTARCASAQARSALLCYVNFARAANGAGPLRQASTLGSAARVKGGAIVRCGDFSHGPCGSDPTAAVRASGYGFRLWGENLYWGSGPLGSARNAVGGWLRSPAHRSAMLDRRFREIGIAAVAWPGRGTVWVIELGTR